MVLQVYAAANLAPPAGAIAALVRLQRPLCGKNAGSFSYSWADADGDGTFERSGPNNLAATIAAIGGLLLAELPQAPAAVVRAAPRPDPC
jgi:hypothetical protein